MLLAILAIIVLALVAGVGVGIVCGLLDLVFSIICIVIDFGGIIIGVILAIYLIREFIIKKKG